MTGTIRRLLLVAGLAATLLVGWAVAASAEELPPGGSFVDDDLLSEEGYIEAIFAAGITRGCNPPDNDEFCPKTVLSRAQMASLFVRALGLPEGTPGTFADIAESIHADDIRSLADAGITKGCDPPTNELYCPDRGVSRGEMAAFIVRAFDLAASDQDFFSDDDGTTFEGDINALAAAGISSGCGGDSFCPFAPLTRAQMAVFIAKALHLTPNVPPERPPPPYPQVGDGKRIIYSNSEQRVWLIDEDNQLVDTYLVSGRKGIPKYDTYTVYSKSVKAYAPYGGITMSHMVRFVRPGTFGNQWAYGFHGIPRYPNGTRLQTDDELGTHRSGGCVRQNDYKAEALYAWADIGTTVHAIP